MPNIASVLKSEISRLAKKELRSETDSLKKAVSHYRSEIAALKRRIDALERQQKRVAKALPAKVAVHVRDDAKHRFSAQGLATHRQRLGLSAADFGALIGASGLSVYKWEKGEVRPREKYIAAIAGMRNIGKREAAARLEQLEEKQ
jgi:DNA-binding transcriptional regulator YiaG